MWPSHSLTVISLGGGVQSSVMALMASEGEFGKVPDCAIFADTHWEPPTIYTHLDWLSSNLSFPLYAVDNGRSLREDVKALTNHSGNRGFIDLTLYLKGPARAGVRNGQGDGMGRRQCTEHYKIRPIQRKIRELLGLSMGQRVPADTTVELWLGISTDETIRMKTSSDRWIHNRYPLIEVGMSRKDCLEWWGARYDRPLERSACIGCPYQSPSPMDRDQTQVPGAVRRGDRDRLEHARTARPPLRCRTGSRLRSGVGLCKGTLLASPQDTAGGGCQPRRGAIGTRSVS